MKTVLCASVSVLLVLVCLSGGAPEAPNPQQVLDVGRQLKEDGRGFEMLDLYFGFLLSEPRGHTGAASEVHPETYLHIADQVLSEVVYVGEGEAFVARLRTAVAQHPQNPEPLRHAGHLLLKMRHHEEGVRELERYLAIKAKPLAADYAWTAGLCENVGRTQDAIRWYEKALQATWTEQDHRWYTPGQVQVDPRTRIRWSLANLYLRQQQWAEAQVRLKEIVDSGGGWYEEQAKAKLTEIWERTGQQSVFREDLEQRIAGDPCNVALRRDYAEMSLRAGQTQAAVAQFEQAVALSPGDLSLRLQLARALAGNRETDRALAEYKAVLYAAMRKNRDEFRPGKGGDETEPARVLFEIVGLYERLGNVEARLALYEEVLEWLKSPGVLWQPDPYVHERLLRDTSEIYNRKGERDRAVRLWLTYRETLGRAARYALADSFGYHSPLRAPIETGREPVPRPPSVGSSGLLRPYIETLQEETGADPNDSWGRFILGDMLAADHRPQEAMDVYMKLLHNVPPDRELHGELAFLFTDMGRDDLRLIALEKALSTLEKGTGEYTQKLGQMAALHLKLGDKAEAARRYREAIAAAPSEPEFQYGLFAATGGQEGKARPARESTGSLKEKRARAQLLLNQGSDPGEVVKLCEQILREAPTDVVSMACLARAYEQLGRKSEAVSWFEKAHTTRRWSSIDPGAASDLQRLYTETGQDDKLLTLLREQDDHMAVRDFHQSRGQPEKFEQYLLDRMKHEPDTPLRWYLGRHYLDTGNREAAARVYETLHAQLADEQGRVTDLASAVSLARGFEGLNRLEEALAILAFVDCEHEADAEDWLGELLTRLHAKTSQFEKMFDVCILRLKKHPQEYRTIETATQIGDLLKDVPDGRKLIDGLFENLRGQIPEPQYERFRGALVSYINAHWPPAREAGQSLDPLTLLKEGRKVTVPQGCRSLSEFLEKLASQADTVAVGSFLDTSGREMGAPQVGMTTGSAFEVLAAALNGTNAGMEMTQEGHWLLSANADPNRTFSYAASGGLICVTDGFNRRADRPAPWLLGRVFFEPPVRAHVVSFQWDFQVVEAVDDRGRTVPVVPIPSSKLRWNSVGQIEAHLLQQEPPATRIMKMRVRTAVAYQAALPLKPAMVPSPIGFPAGVEIIPFELTFRDLPIIEQPPKAR